MRAEETVAPSTSAPLAERLSVGVRERRNWRQLVKFVIVGGSGYAANLLVFTLGVNVLELHHLIAASLAFVVAVSNNFWWNRHWTFGAGGESARFQAPRFFAVSTAAFVAQAAMLELLVVGAGSPEVIAQAISVVAATPLNFVGNKMWSFASERVPA